MPIVTDFLSENGRKSRSMKLLYCIFFLLSTEFHNAVCEDCGANDSETCSANTVHSPGQGSDSMSLNFLRATLQTALLSSTTIEHFSKLHDMLQRIQSQQQVKTPWYDEKDRTMNNLDDLKKWCASKFTNLGISWFPDMGFGVRLSQNVKKGAILYSIQMNETVNVRDSRNLFKRFESVLNLTEEMSTSQNSKWTNYVWLSLRLIYERLKPESYWKPYIDSLPQSFVSPMYFSPAEMQYLQPAYGYVAAMELYREMVTRYLQIYIYLLENTECCTDLYLTDQSFTFDIYRWAFVAVLSRTWTDAILPCWDYVNHGEKQMETTIEHEYTSATDSEPQSAHQFIVSTATRDLVEGDQLFHDYHITKVCPISHFFNFWGFVEPKGSVLFSININPSNPSFQRVSQLLESYGCKTTFDVVIVQDNELPIAKETYPCFIIAISGTDPSEITQSHWKQMWMSLADQIASQAGRIKGQLRDLKKKNTIKSENAKLGELVVDAEQSMLERTRQISLQLAEEPLRRLEPRKV